MGHQIGKVLFLPCFLDGLSPLSASVRFRAQWPAKYMINGEAYDGSQRLADFNCFVFQKFYLSDKARSWAHAFRDMGHLLAFDLCDADFLLSDIHRERMLKVLPRFDFAVAPTGPLVEWLRRWLPAFLIPDRLDLSVHAERHVPQDREPQLVWFGNSGNLVTLEQMWPAVCDLGLSLTVLSDRLVPPWDGRPVRFVEWTLEGANAEIARHDVALNPKLDTGHFAYKSNNKTVTARALGVPVAGTPEQLMALMDFELRRLESAYRLAEVAAHYDVRVSALEWAGLFDEWRRRRGQG
jgi:hypothetical protein